MNINEGEINTSVKYIRTILPKQEIVLIWKIKVWAWKISSSRYLFRDYLGKEWFKDSYGKFEEMQDYKEMLKQKNINSTIWWCYI